MFAIMVMRAEGGGEFSIEYHAAADGNRVQVRLTCETLQDEFDRNGEPLRAYITRQGVPIEAAYCLRGARD